MATEEKQVNQALNSLIEMFAPPPPRAKPTNNPDLVDLDDDSSDEEIVGPAPKKSDTSQILASLMSMAAKAIEKMPEKRVERTQTVKSPEHSDEYLPEEDVDFEIELDFDSMVDEIKRKHDLLTKEVFEYKNRCEKLTTLNGKLLTENLSLKKRIHSLTKS